MFSESEFSVYCDLGTNVLPALQVRTLHQLGNAVTEKEQNRMRCNA
jgi:hypothetical protein